MLSDLSKFLVPDTEKQDLIEDIYIERLSVQNKDVMLCAPDLSVEETKFCPQCNRKYPGYENICMDCLVTLKNISEKPKIRDIEYSSVFTVKGKNTFTDFESIFTEKNANLINDFRFSLADYNDIIRNIKRTSLRNLDKLIKDNNINLDDLSILDKILLFTKSFTKVEYKSYGQELGYFESDTITVDDRQRDSLQITTMIHELSHFILKEIIAEVLCKLLDCTKNEFIDNLATYILSYDSFTRLIDEYSAHCCEGRFTVYGYQDYSSFLSIIEEMNGEMTSDEIEITKAIGNTFANSIKDILEIFIDSDLLFEIKENFLSDNFEKPNYEMLKLENCQLLTDEGFMKALWLVVSEGFNAARLNRDKLEGVN